MLGVQTHLSDVSSHLWISFAPTPSMKSSFSSAFLSKMRSKIFSWKDPTNQREKLIEVFVEGKTWYSNVLRRFRLDVNLCTSILEVAIRLMSWLVRFRISFMRRFSSTVRAERELSLWLIQWSAHLQKRWGHPGHSWDLKNVAPNFWMFARHV